MTSTSRLPVFTAFVLVTAGCVGNGYTKYYRGNPDGRTAENYIAPSGPLEIYSTNDMNRDVEAMERRGCSPIGSSAFNGTANPVSDRHVRESAETVHASAVLVSSHYSHTVAGALPMQLPNNSTAFTTENATVYGPYGTANVYGSSTTNIYGPQTVMMPYNIQRNDFSAEYFVKRKVRFGVFYGVIDAPTRGRFQTNAGVLMKTVVDGSPAARADIFPGDIVLTVDGERVDGNEALNRLLKDRLGRDVLLGIDRNGTHVEKTVAIAP